MKQEPKNEIVGQQPTKMASKKADSVPLKLVTYLLAFLAAAGSSLQHFEGVSSFLGQYATLFLNGSGILGLSLATGGVMSGLINLSINFECLEDFIDRVFNKPFPKLRGWRGFRYWLGSGVFLITGVLFGATAVAFGSVGALAGIALAAGIFVSILMLIQELETWLKSFDDNSPELVKELSIWLTSAQENDFDTQLQIWVTEKSAAKLNAKAKLIEELNALLKKDGTAITKASLEKWLKDFNAKSSLWSAFKKYWMELTPGKAVGLIITLVNVFALSLLFTMGVATFLTGFGVPLLPALIAGFAIGFTGGAFTEFYFYNAFLSDFFSNVSKKWSDFKNEKNATSKIIDIPWKVIGVAGVTVNALVNVALTYTGIVLLNTLMLSAGLSIIPLPVIFVAAAFAGLASFALCSDFWIRNSKTILKYSAAILTLNCAAIAESGAPPAKLSPASTAKIPNAAVVGLAENQERVQSRSCWSSLFGPKGYTPIPAQNADFPELDSIVAHDKLPKAAA